MTELLSPPMPRNRTDACSAELMIWGDQHDPAYFDYFAENNLLHHFAQFLQQRDNRQGDVAKQVCCAPSHRHTCCGCTERAGAAR